MLVTRIELRSWQLIKVFQQYFEIYPLSNCAPIPSLLLFALSEPYTVLFSVLRTLWLKFSMVTIGAGTREQKQRTAATE